MGFPLKKRVSAFTLLELLVAAAVLAMILALLLPVLSSVTRIVSSNPPTFQEARTAFETMNRLLSQAVMNTYWDYDNPHIPERYLRASELHFVLGAAPTLTGLPQSRGSAVFFQAPLGQSENSDLRNLRDLLNSAGFYVAFSQSEHLPPYLISEKPQTAAWRLWMWRQPPEDLSVYSLYNADPQGTSQTTWFLNDLGTASHTHVLANNVVLLLFRASYEDASGNLVESYIYDSRPTFSGSTQPIEMHQIPPLLHATLVVIDQKTADRLLASSGGSRYDLISDDLFKADQADQYAQDIEDLQIHLNGRPLSGIPVNYRIFEATLPMNASQWSRN